MAAPRLPLLQRRVTAVERFESPAGGGGGGSTPPQPDPATHRANLLQQLDAMAHTVKTRGEDARDVLATREIIAVRPVAGSVLAAKQLANSKANAWFAGEIHETATVLLDVARVDLTYLRDKINAFADDSATTLKRHRDRSPRIARASEIAVAPIEFIGLAQLEDLVATRLMLETLVLDRAYWFEIGCRGGYRNPEHYAEGSQIQVSRQLHRVGANQVLTPFSGPEQVYFYVRATPPQLAAVQAATDCIYGAAPAPAHIRDDRLFDMTKTTDVAGFRLDAPGRDAPSVVLLDTGIATSHPLLAAAILTATTAGPEIPSPEDTEGHGTEMAGIALYRDLGAAIERGTFIAPHWLQSSRLLVAPGKGTASAENYEMWPLLTQKAAEAAESADPEPRKRAFVLAVTSSMQDPPFDGVAPTLWSQAVDQLAFAEGQGRLMIVSAGNARYEQWLGLAENYPQLQLAERIHQPAQAFNALTVGAYTERTQLPDDPTYAETDVVAPKSGGISPFTSTGPADREWEIKPEVLFEGGNLAIAGGLLEAGVTTLSALTTGHRHALNLPLSLLSMTSEASARAGNLAAHIWTLEPSLRPATVRALIVHSASWTKVMRADFPGISDRLQACGYGVPDAQLAAACGLNVATIVIEHTMPNAVLEEEPKKKPPKRADSKTTESKHRRKVVWYRVPIPESLMSDDDPDVELRVTLSYFSEPNLFGRRTTRGLDLNWDMQGPHETEAAFKRRVNALLRPKDINGKRLKSEDTSSFPREIGIARRKRGSVQSDRWCGKMSTLVGDKLIAVAPVLGWWDQRKKLRLKAMEFSLVVSVFGPGVYDAIKPLVEVTTEVMIDV